MSARRIARRVALRMQRQNPCHGGVRAGSLARKVFRRLPTKGSFPEACDWLAGVLVWLQPMSTGVGLAPERGGECRIEWGSKPALTLFGRVVVVTKEPHGGTA